MNKYWNELGIVSKTALVFIFISAIVIIIMGVYFKMNEPLPCGNEFKYYLGMYTLAIQENDVYDTKKQKEIIETEGFIPFNLENELIIDDKTNVNWYFNLDGSEFFKNGNEKASIFYRNNGIYIGDRESENPIFIMYIEKDKVWLSKEVIKGIESKDETVLGYLNDFMDCVKYFNDNKNDNINYFIISQLYDDIFTEYSMNIGHINNTEIETEGFIAISLVDWGYYNSFSNNIESILYDCEKYLNNLNSTYIPECKLVIKDGVFYLEKKLDKGFNESCVFVLTRDTLYVNSNIYNSTMSKKKADYLSMILDNFLDALVNTSYFSTLHNTESFVEYILENSIEQVEFHDTLGLTFYRTTK